MPVLDREPSLVTDFNNLSSLLLQTWNMDGLQAYQKILEANPSVKELRLTAEGFTRNEAIAPDDLQDSSTRAGLLSRTVFSHFQSLGSCSPLMLTSLSLHYISLRCVADTYLRYIRFSCLKDLEIIQCAGVENLFAQLIKPHIRPCQLRTLRWNQRMEAGTSGQGEPHIVEAFEELLEILLGLETLHVELDNINELLQVKAITHHAKTLKSLYIFGTYRKDDGKGLFYEPADFTEICTSCSKLIQLAVAFPDTSVDTFGSTEPSTAYATFVVSF